MALPSSENLAYRGINTGNAKCIAYRGFICEEIIVDLWNDAIRFSVNIVRRFRNRVEF